MKNDIILLDGGMGTTLWERIEEKIPVWRYNLEKPEMVLGVHKDMIEAGSRIIMSNTFSANRPTVEGSGYTVEQVVSAGMKIAKEAKQWAKETLDVDVQVGLDVGPLTGLLQPFGTITVDDAKGYYEEQIGAGLAEGPDLVFLETFMDLEMVKIAASVVREKSDIDLYISMSFSKVSRKKGPRTMLGNSVPDIVEGVRGFGPKAVGLNCSMGPEEALEVIQVYSEYSDIPLLFKPNAGKPTLEGGSQFDYKIFATEVSKAADVPGVKYIGGCCGSSPKYIEALRQKLSDL